MEGGGCPGGGEVILGYTSPPPPPGGSCPGGGGELYSVVPTVQWGLIFLLRTILNHEVETGAFIPYLAVHE